MNSRVFLGCLLSLVSLSLLGLYYGSRDRHQSFQGEGIFIDKQPFPFYRIIAAGSQRSGSTWQYNTLRVLLAEAFGLEPFVVSGHGHLSEKEMMLDVLSNRYAVVKLHEFSHELLESANFVFTSHRDPRDVVSSWISFWKAVGKPVEIAYTVREVEKGYEQYWKWAPLSCFDMPYEDLLTRELDIIRGMAERLHLLHLVNPEHVQRRVKDLLNATKEGWDPLTGFHTNHINLMYHLQYRSVLNTTEVKVIEARFGKWLDFHGYASDSFSLAQKLPGWDPCVCPLACQIVQKRKDDPNEGLVGTFPST